MGAVGAVGEAGGRPGGLSPAVTLVSKTLVADVECNARATLHQIIINLLETNSLDKCLSRNFDLC